MRVFTVIFLLGLAACTAGEPLPPIEGYWANSNPTYWHPTPDEQQAIDSLPVR